MFVGNVKAAIRLLSDNECRGVHSLDSMIDNHSVKDILLEKHPSAQPLHLSTLVSSSSPNVFHSVLFDSITPELVKSVMLKINGSAGPSGLDAAAWKRLCTFFQSSSVDLCSALASLTRRLYTSYVDPSGLYPLLASRLITLDKLPGVRQLVLVRLFVASLV